MSPAVRPGIRVVFVARPEVAGAKTRDVETEMRALLDTEIRS
jgi:hypothetical protein